MEERKLYKTGQLITVKGLGVVQVRKALHFFPCNKCDFCHGKNNETIMCKKYCYWDKPLILAKHYFKLIINLSHA